MGHLFRIRINFPSVKDAVILSLKTEAISATNALNPTNLRRENILPREELLYGQHFTLGASYNGLNNMLRGSAGGMNGRNPGLSLHAGISF
jgi:hypothetical protein